LLLTGESWKLRGTRNIGSCLTRGEILLDGVDDILYEVTSFCGLNGEVYPLRKREGFIGSAESAKLKFWWGVH
jgi:hypothetical protein